MGLKRPDKSDPRLADPTYVAAFEAARAKVLRRRIVWTLGILLGLLAISGWGSVLEYQEYKEGKTTPLELVVIGVLEDLALWGVLLATLLYVLRGAAERRKLVKAVLVCIVSATAVAVYFEIRRAVIQQSDFMGDPLPYPVDPRDWACRWALFTHGLLVAMPLIIVPTRWAESRWMVAGCMLAFVPLVLVFADAPAGMAAAYSAAAVAVTIPPVLYSQWRYARFDAVFQHAELKDRFGELSAELTQARRLHESLFPAPVEEGPVRVGFVYEPMRAIGGDFLFMHPASAPGGTGVDGPIVIALIDVSGHGVASALAVNRLHGELTRICSDAAASQSGGGLSAGRLIEELNAFVYAALGPQGVFATAVCVKIEPGREDREGAGVSIEWSNAGHPPALMRSRAGKVHRLGPTATMLGVLEPEMFTANSKRMEMVPGDRLVAYTDGLPETRDAEGRELGIARVEELFAAATGNAWSSTAGVAGGAAGVAKTLVDAAARHRAAGARVTDDTLVVEVVLAGWGAGVGAEKVAEPVQAG